MATLVGRVGMVTKGDYNSASTYEVLDVVTYNNGLYVAKQNVPANTVPTNTTYWQPAIIPAGFTTWADNNFLGAKNLNSYPYYETSHTDHTVVWTDNGDGTVKANGQASGSNSDFNCHYHMNDPRALIVPNGRYIISGCPIGGSLTSYYIQVGTRDSDGNFTLYGRDTGNGLTIDIDGGYESPDYAVLNITCRVATNYNASNIVFKPMIRIASDADSTFAAFAETNRDLTKDIQTFKCTQSTAGNYKLRATVASNGTVTYSWVSE